MYFNPESFSLSHLSVQELFECFCIGKKTIERDFEHCEIVLKYMYAACGDKAPPWGVAMTN